MSEERIIEDQEPSGITALEIVSMAMNNVRILEENKIVKNELEKLIEIQQPVVVEVIQEPEEVIEDPVEVIQEPEELIELRRMYLAGETDMSEEMYIRQTEGLMRWWAETGAKQQQN